MITAKEYDLIEKEKITENSILPVKAFYPLWLQSNGFILNQFEDKEIWKYANTMHWARFEQTFHFLRNLSEQEYDLIKRALSFVHKLSKDKLYKEVLPINPILRAVLPTRAIEKLKNDNDKVFNVLEIGPGSGYLGLLLLMKGFNYTSVENAKPLYLFQSLLFSNYTKNHYELLNLENNNEDYNNFQSLHIPWWVIIDQKLKLKKYDFIILNHCISEINRHAFLFYILLIKKFLKKNGYIIIEGWGGGVNEQNVFEVLKNFQLVHNIGDGYINDKYLPISIFMQKKENIFLQSNKITTNSKNIFKNTIKLIVKSLGLYKVLLLIVKKFRKKKLNFSDSFDGRIFRETYLSNISSELALKENAVNISEFKTFINSNYTEQLITGDDDKFLNIINDIDHV